MGRVQDVRHHDDPAAADAADDGNCGLNAPTVLVRDYAVGEKTHPLAAVVDGAAGVSGKGCSPPLVLLPQQAQNTGTVNALARGQQNEKNSEGYPLFEEHSCHDSEESCFALYCCLEVVVGVSKNHENYHTRTYHHHDGYYCCCMYHTTQKAAQVGVHCGGS